MGACINDTSCYIIAMVQSEHVPRITLGVRFVHAPLLDELRGRGVVSNDAAEKDFASPCSECSLRVTGFDIPPLSHSDHNRLGRNKTNARAKPMECANRDGQRPKHQRIGVPHKRMCVISMLDIRQPPPPLTVLAKPFPLPAGTTPRDSLDNCLAQSGRA